MSLSPSAQTRRRRPFLADRRSGIESANRAVADCRGHVSIEDFDAALDEILADCALSMQKAYNRAVETSGQVQMCKSVMEAIASINEPEVPFRRIREAFLEIHPKTRTPRTSTSSASP